MQEPRQGGLQLTARSRSRSRGESLQPADAGDAGSDEQGSRGGGGGESQGRAGSPVMLNFVKDVDDVWDSRGWLRLQERLRSLHRRTVLVLFAVALMLTVAVASMNPEWADECMLTPRQRTEAMRQWAIPASPLFLAVEVIIFLCFACHVVAARNDRAAMFGQVYLSCCTLVLFLGWAGVVVALKYALGDMSCHLTHPNSVSGHTHFYVFYCLNLPRIAVEGHRTQHRHATSFWVMAYATVVALSAFQGYRTYEYGFHSMRQMLYGWLVSMVASALFARSVGAEAQGSAPVGSPLLALSAASAAAGVGAGVVFGDAPSVTFLSIGVPAALFAAAAFYAHRRRVESYADMTLPGLTSLS